MSDHTIVKREPVMSLGWLWFVGWLFTIGYVHLGFWQGVFALCIWPYYLGSVLR